jgi:hypothetical protein
MLFISAGAGPGEQQGDNQKKCSRSHVGNAPHIDAPLHILCNGLFGQLRLAQDGQSSAMPATKNLRASRLEEGLCFRFACSRLLLDESYASTRRKPHRFRRIGRLTAFAHGRSILVIRILDA